MYQLRIDSSRYKGTNQNLPIRHYRAPILHRRRIIILPPAITITITFML